MRRLLADSDEQVFEFLNIVDIATRSNICFPVPSKRPDDVLSVLEMVWINWAGPMCHLISDTGGEFEGELVTASEAPWQESGCHKGNKRCRSTRFRGNAKTRLHCELGKECSNQLVWTLACPKGHLSRTQVALVALDEKQSGELASLELPDHSPEFGRRMSCLWATHVVATTVCATESVHTHLWHAQFHRLHTAQLFQVWSHQILAQAVC